MRKIKLSESCTHQSPVWVIGCATIRFDFVIQQQQVNINLIHNCSLSTNTLNHIIQTDSTHIILLFQSRLECCKQRTKNIKILDCTAALKQISNK